MKERVGQKIKAIVVEDEEKIGRYISEKIESLDPSISVEGTAANGVEALQLIEKCWPQVVFTDINMSVMDGLELAKTIKENYPGIIVVIISGHSKFSYARQAIQYGVFNYILKPIEDEELSDTLYDIRKALSYSRREQERQILYSDTTMLQKTGHIRYMIFSVCIGNLMYDGKDPALARYYGDQMRLIPWKEIMGEVCGDRWNWFLADEEPVKQKIAGIQIKEGDAVSVNGLAYKLSEEITRQAEPAVHICCPKEAVTNDKIWDTAKHLRYRMQRELVACQRQILVEKKDDGQEKNMMEIVKMRLGSDIKNYFLTMERKNLTDNIQSLLSYMIQTGMTQSSLEKVCLYILKLLEFSEGYHDAEFLKNLQMSLQRGIGLAASEGDLLQQMEGFSSKINGYMNRIFDENIEERLLGYVDAHFLTMENLKEAADVLGYNYAYLSRLFKKITGMPVTRYITEKKINMAKELLIARPDITLEEISGMCGYYDTSYFIRVFKKHTGATPGEYRMDQTGEPQELLE